MYCTLKGGAADAAKRVSGPLSVIMQNVQVSAACVTEKPVIKDTYIWDDDKQGRPLRSAVCVPRFSDFAGSWGQSNIELNATHMRLFQR